MGVGVCAVGEVLSERGGEASEVKDTPKTEQIRKTHTQSKRRAVNKDTSGVTLPLPRVANIVGLQPCRTRAKQGMCSFFM